MTREGVKYASKDYVNYLLDKQEYHNENYTEDDIRQAFEKGAEWADEHPKSPWISVKNSLPCDHDNLKYFGFTVKVIVIDINRNISFNHMVKDKNTGKWKWEDGEDDAEVTNWTPIPKLVN